MAISRGYDPLSQLTVKIIGCGRMGRERARCVTSLGAVLVGVSDVDPACALTLAKDYGCEIISPQAAFQHCDAVFVCSPPEPRPSLAAEAIRCGTPFFAEKPISTTVKAAEAVAAALERNPLPNAVGYMNRYRASVQYAGRTLRDRETLGFVAHWAGRPYGVPWWADRQISGGPLNEQATHLFDLARYLCGEIEEVRAVHSSKEPFFLPSTAVALQFVSGAIGTILYTCGAQAKDIGVRVITKTGSVALAGWTFDIVEAAGTQIPAAAQEDVFLIETRAFLDSLGTPGTSQILSTWPDALRTQRVVEAANLTLQAAASL